MTVRITQFKETTQGRSSSHNSQPSGQGRHSNMPSFSYWLLSPQNKKCSVTKTFFQCKNANKKFIDVECCTYKLLFGSISCFIRVDMHRVLFFKQKNRNALFSRKLTICFITLTTKWTKLKLFINKHRYIYDQFSVIGQYDCLLNKMKDFI